MGRRLGAAPRRRAGPVRLAVLCASLLSALAQVGGGQVEAEGGKGGGGSVRWHLGSKSPYVYGGGAGEEPDPPGCRAVLMVGLLRHGSRNPGKTDGKHFNKLSEKLSSMPPESFAEGFKWLSGWKNPYRHVKQHGLVDQGILEHYGIARRIRERYPHLTDPYTPSHHHIRSSHLERSSRSAAAFAYGLWEGTGPQGAGGYNPAHIATPLDGTRDTLLRFVDYCPRYQQIIDYQDGLRQRDAFRRGEEVEAAARRIQERMGLGGVGGFSLTPSEASAIYTMCGFEMGHQNKSDAFCSLLSEQDVEVFEYLDDLKHYYKKAYGHAVNAEMACPLLQHMLGALEKRANGSSHQRADLLFAHAETLVPLLTRLGLYKDAFALQADTDPMLRRGRLFRSSFVTPMAANFFFVLYQCSDGDAFRVRALHNEHTVRLPACPREALCPLASLLEAHRAHCDFDASCACVGPEGASICVGGQAEEKKKEGSGATLWPTSMDTVLGGTEISPHSLHSAILVALMSLLSAVGLAFCVFRFTW